jgi:hypothetical protein
MVPHSCLRPESSSLLGGFTSPWQAQDGHSLLENPCQRKAAYFPTSVAG